MPPDYIEKDSEKKKETYAHTPNMRERLGSLYTFAIENKNFVVIVVILFLLADLFFLISGTGCFGEMRQRPPSLALMSLNMGYRKQRMEGIISRFWEQAWIRTEKMYGSGLPG